MTERLNGKWKGWGREERGKSREEGWGRIKGIRSNLKGPEVIYNPPGVQCAHHPALWSWAVFDLPHGSSHLFSGEAGSTKGQSNVISSLVEPLALLGVLVPFCFHHG